ncbi:MAG: FecR family protein [Xanthobacteraceae bacterium]
MRDRFTSLIGLVAALGLVAAPACADPIATATTVKVSAVGELAGKEHTLQVGGELAQDEIIKTDGAGNAHLKFIDDTSLLVGPASTIKLDKFVFNPNKKASEFVLDATRGAFRFATGHSEHRAYEIVTPVAVIGVRGTQFAFGLERNRMTLVVTDGVVTSCTRTTLQRCVSAAAGNTIIATPTGATVRRTVGAVPVILRSVLVLPTTRVRATQIPTRVVTPVTAGGQPQGTRGRIIGPGLLENDQTLPPQGPRPIGTPITPNTGRGN